VGAVASAVFILIYLVGPRSDVKFEGEEDGVKARGEGEDEDEDEQPHPGQVTPNISPFRG
jgi:hypothetical protein